ncbi:MAG TPA: NADP-dependent malic enzyme [Nitrososphaerales archaeon]|nr:NADP-dependent malic enzyme [Nitrososphaerales archaeon]
MSKQKFEGHRPTADELLAKAKKPSMLAPPLHRFYGGKLQVMPKCAISSYQDFAVWYTPGVAAACKEIQASPEKAYELTNKWNFVAIVTDGTRVLGLGNIGPEAALPVMEGKSILFKYLGGVDAFPICLKTRDPEEILRTLEVIQPTFGGINLEDIEKPKCFYILEEARKRLKIPVWHDDQQGTATVVLAGLINAFKVVGKNPKESLITLVGAGAANLRTAYVLMKWGVPSGNILLVDTKGLIYPGRKDIVEKDDRWKYELSQKTNAEGRQGDMAAAFRDVDAVVAAAQPGPGVIKPEWIKTMKENSIIFACANPIPEIWPWEAEEAGARIIGTGRSDFPNQINNSLGFPGIFRGVLDVRATTVTDDMCVAAAEEMARFAEARGMNEQDLIPRMDEWEVYPRVAVACAQKSMDQGLARVKPSRDELYQKAVAIIECSRGCTDLLMKAGRIKCMPPESELLR